MAKLDIKSMNITELEDLLKELGEPKFRAKQIFDWLHAKQVDSFEEMTNLSKGLREKLSETASINGVEIVRKLVSQIDGTRKYLFALSDGAIIESVLMKYEHGNTVCISTQV
ncbi:MAG: 23S rRNA (adenine(2503)-C(2))-methyltransferase RlmN, partial [Anaerotignum sp.]|nr:23S rRNA (adenine(2503)-C(2))-methyltransferase RlmN [Anaerotignum sp.]